MTVRLVAVAEVIRQAASSGASQPVFGFARGTEGLIQILSAEPGPDDQFVEIGTVNAAGSPEERNVALTLEDRGIILSMRPGLPMPAAVDIVDVSSELDTRRINEASCESLTGKVITLVGAGSLGSTAGLLLAEAGVGQFLVVDYDRLEASNLSRHACDLFDLGRSKVKAVSDLLGRRLACAEPVECDLTELTEDELDRLVATGDVVIATTDSPAVQFCVNEACIRTETPAVFAGAYERACGGEVTVVQPGVGPCLFCAVGFRARLAEEICVKERRQAYQDADAMRLEAEPGLGADIAYLSTVASAYVLAVLQPSGSRAQLLDPRHALVLVHGGSQPRDTFSDLFQLPFDFVRATVERSEPCPVCGWTTAES